MTQGQAYNTAIWMLATSEFEKDNLCDYYCVEEIMSGVKLENEAILHVHLLRSKFVKSRSWSW